MSFSEKTSSMIPSCDHFYVFTDDERRAINRIGAETGCHTCGTKDPGTRSGNFIGDLQPPSALNWQGHPQRIAPHCLFCKKVQGAAIRELVIRNGRAPSRGVETPGYITFVADVAVGGGPITIDRGRNIWPAQNCIAIGLRSFMDAMTEMIFASRDFRNPLTEPQFDGFIDTPSRCLGVFTVDNELLGESVATDVRTRIRVWTDHPTEPDKIDVVFG